LGFYYILPKISPAWQDQNDMKRERGPLASVKGAEFYDWRRGDFSMMHFTASPSRHVDRKSTRLNSSHVAISYAVFCLKKKTSTFKRPVSSWKALNLRKTLLMASSVRLKPLNCSRLPCVYAHETLTFLLTQKKTCVNNYVQKE